MLFAHYLQVLFANKHIICTVYLHQQAKTNATHKPCTHQTLVCSWAKTLLHFCLQFLFENIFQCKDTLHNCPLNRLVGLKKKKKKQIWKKWNVKLMSHSPLQISHSRVCIIQRLLHFSKDELKCTPCCVLLLYAECKISWERCYITGSQCVSICRQAGPFVVC